MRTLLFIPLDRPSLSVRTTGSAADALVLDRGMDDAALKQILSEPRGEVAKLKGGKAQTMTEPRGMDDGTGSGQGAP